MFKPTGQGRRRRLVPRTVQDVDHAAQAASRPPAHRPLTASVAVLWHVGCTDTFQNMLREWPSLLHLPNATYVFTSHSSDMTCVIRENFPKATIRVIENRGQDIGGFISALECLEALGADVIFKIHTKTNKAWRDGMLNNLIQNYKSIVSHLATITDHPALACDRKYLYRNRKQMGMNSTWVDECDFDTYAERECSTSFPVDATFYATHEPDLCLEGAVQHWNSHGKHEFHRVQNPLLVQHYGRYSHCFPAGCIFIANKAFGDEIRRIAPPLAQFEPGRVVHRQPTLTHSLEYYFGYCARDHVYDTDLAQYKREQTTESETAVVFRPFNEARVAILLRHMEGIIGGMRTLLRYVNRLLADGIGVDLYVGIMSPRAEVRILEQLDVLSSYGDLCLKRVNLYKGWKVHRDYDVILATAWQTLSAAVHSRTHAKHLGYVVQDAEYLFYPEKPRVQQFVRATYVPTDIHYFCLSRMLYDMFKDKHACVEGRLGVDTDLYRAHGHPRKKSVIVALYHDKPVRMPKRIVRIIELLAGAGIPCSVFPHDYSGPHTDMVQNMGHLTQTRLVDLYNEGTVGIVMSGSNPSRIPFEMRACGLHVIENGDDIEPGVTHVNDLPDNNFTRLTEATTRDCVSIVKKIFTETEATESFVPHTVTQEHQVFSDFVKALL